MSNVQLNWCCNHETILADKQSIATTSNEKPKLKLLWHNACWPVSDNAKHNVPYNGHPFNDGQHPVAGHAAHRLWFLPCSSLHNDSMLL
jgi:hypothetical protein